MSSHIDQRLPPWPKADAFERIRQEANSLQHWRINPLSLTNIPCFGDVFAMLYRIKTMIGRYLFPPKRQVPSLGDQDTFIAGEGGKAVSKHMNDNQSKSFKNYEILRIHALTSPISLAPEIPSSVDFFPSTPAIEARRDENGRFVLLQTGIRACSAAVSAMLILDAGRQCDRKAMRSRNVSNNKVINEDLDKAGLTPLSTSIKSLQELHRLIVKNGPAIVSVTGDIGGHVIIVDELNRNTASIRDPFHGWSVTIPRAALRGRIQFGDSVIQVERDK